MAKYDPLKEFLDNNSGNDITLSFEQVKGIINGELPYSAYNHRAWWSNEVKGSHGHAQAWMDAGWKVDQVDQSAHWVRFVRK